MTLANVLMFPVEIFLHQFIFTKIPLDVNHFLGYEGTNQIVHLNYISYTLTLEDHRLEIFDGVDIKQMSTCSLSTDSDITWYYKS